MEIKLGVFPAVYLNPRCRAHSCLVEIHLEGSKKFGTEPVVGAQITALKCQVAGPVQVADCTEFWEVSILGPGPVTVGP